MSALDDWIESSRRRIRQLEAEGADRAAEIESARLSGLVDARSLAGGSDHACLHRVHKADGDDNGKQRWRCVDCGAIA